jgi:hypothetical protein
LAAKVNQDHQTIAVIGGRLEGAVGEIASTQGMVKEVAGLAATDRKTID